MTPPTPTITVEVDLTNPGQFLACCGLLELASRLDPEALGWFDENRFHVALAGPELWDALLRSTCIAFKDGSDASGGGGDPEAKSPPVAFGDPFHLVLDWWTDDAATRAGFKTWSGGQTVIGFIDGMRRHIAGHINEPRGLFAVMPLRKPKPFYFDSRISRLTSLDLGFSAEGFTTAFSPAVELLALIGMQRFRPRTVIEREHYTFATWNTLLPVCIAAAVAAGVIPTLIDRSYQFPLVFRTGGKYKAFGPGTLERSLHA